MDLGFDGEDEEDEEEVDEEEVEDLLLVLLLLLSVLVQLAWWPEPSSRRRPGRLAKKYWHSMPRASHLEHEGFSLGHLILEAAQDWQLSRSLVQPSALRRTVGGVWAGTALRFGSGTLASTVGIVGVFGLIVLRGGFGLRSIKRRVSVEVVGSHEEAVDCGTLGSGGHSCHCCHSCHSC